MGAPTPTATANPHAATGIEELRTAQTHRIGVRAPEADVLERFVGRSDAHMLGQIEQALGRPVTFIGADEIRAQTGISAYSGALLDAEGCGGRRPVAAARERPTLTRKVRRIPSDSRAS